MRKYFQSTYILILCDKLDTMVVYSLKLFKTSRVTLHCLDKATYSTQPEIMYILSSDPALDLDPVLTQPVIANQGFI